MKNANVFVDVDLTLVDAQGRLREGAREGLSMLKRRGCHLYLWSSAGGDYARVVADRYALTDLFEGFCSKPDIVIDDMPSTTVAPFTFCVDPETSWIDLARSIVSRHVD